MADASREWRQECAGRLAADLAARGELFERGVPFRHDWEAVLTPVIDALAARPDVDSSALTGYGISQGG
jgi:hypothetical protein